MERQSPGTSARKRLSAANAHRGRVIALFLTVLESPESRMLPLEIRLALVATLFSRISNVAMTMAAAVVIATTVFVRHGNPTMEIIATLDVSLLMARCLLIWRHRRTSDVIRNEPSPWIVGFGLLALGSSCCWGALCAYSLLWVHDPVLLTIALATTCATAGAVAARNAAFPRLALLQLACSLTPIIIGCVFASDRGWLSMVCTVPLLFGGLSLVVIERYKHVVSLLVAQRELGRLARTDSLTGLANRRCLDETVGREWSRAVRSGTPLSLVMLDADHFKSYNDLYGHQKGDVVLIAVAGAMRSVARRVADLAARQGGEEFAILLPGMTQPDAASLAERLRAAIAELGIVHAGSAAGVVTVSIGVACLHPTHGGSDTDLSSLADQALYRAKREGRDRVCC